MLEPRPLVERDGTDVGGLDSEFQTMHAQEHDAILAARGLVDAPCVLNYGRYKLPRLVKKKLRLGIQLLKEGYECCRVFSNGLSNIWLVHFDA